MSRKTDRRWKGDRKTVSMKTERHCQVRQKDNVKEDRKTVEGRQTVERKTDRR